MNPLDALGALSDFILGKLKQSAEMQVAKILFQLLLTAWGSFFLTCGSVLSTYALNHLLRGAPFEGGPIWALALGTAMTVMVVCVVYWIRSDPSKLFKGMRFVFPSAEAAAELAQDFEVIQKPDQEKKQ